MLAESMRQELEDVIAGEGDDGRTYLGMSQIGKCARQLYLDLVNGRESPRGLALARCHEGMLHQRDVVERLERAGVPVLEQNRELVAPFDERHRGHIDGEVDGDLLEIKSLETLGDLADIKKNGPREHDQAQVQAYLRYGDYQRGLIVYKVRANGALWVAYVLRDDAAGERLERKARDVLAALDRGLPPACTCGHCRNGRRRR
jgi:hypothetical protein